ncbi:MAG TPA: hypothetical protein VD908_06430 [Cytophagales bacterium]|nr:hypothetical protein [Cytophagales bacterium]
MMKNLKFLAIVAALFLMYACEQKTDVVESGTYQGKVDKVEAEKSEIYVKTDDGKRLELYFTDSTQLLKNDAVVAFEELKEGQSVEVEVEKVGNRLDPITVKILE